MLSECRIHKTHKGEYKVIFVYGLMETHSPANRFATIKDAKEYVRAHTASKKGIPVIVDSRPVH